MIKSSDYIDPGSPEDIRKRWERKRRRRLKKKKKPYNPKPMSIAQICREAKKEGLSYGMYVWKHGV